MPEVIRQHLVKQRLLRGIEPTELTRMPVMADDERMQKLFEGQLFVYSPRPRTLAFCKFARVLIEEAFNRYVSSPSQTDPPSLHTLDPRTAQYALPLEDYAAILGKLKPTFIYHPESQKHLQNIFREVGCTGYAWIMVVVSMSQSAVVT